VEVTHSQNWDHAEAPERCWSVAVMRACGEVPLSRRCDLDPHGAVERSAGEWEDGGPEARPGGRAGTSHKGM
jgi:hypothetical protein